MKIYKKLARISADEFCVYQPVEITVSFFLLFLFKQAGEICYGVVAVNKCLVTDEGELEVHIGVNTLYDEFRQSPCHAGYGFLPCGGMDYQLAYHAVIERRDGIPLECGSFHCYRSDSRSAHSFKKRVLQIAAA